MKKKTPLDFALIKYHALGFEIVESFDFDAAGFYTVDIRKSGKRYQVVAHYGDDVHDEKWFEVTE